MALTPRDEEYVRAEFVALADLCREKGHEPAYVDALIAAHRLPAPSYVLRDGTPMVPAAFFDLLDEAGGPETVAAVFAHRYAAASRTAGDAVGSAEVEAEWFAYLSGEYGVCLRDATPEQIVEKGRLTSTIEALLKEPRPTDGAWIDALRESVDRLDRIERPFSPDFDRRRRFGTRVSRDRLIDEPRRLFAIR